MRKVAVSLAHILFLFAIYPNTLLAINEARLALIIGNSNYMHGGSLVNPINDVRAMAKVLKALEFSVMKYENCTQKEMKKAIDTFGTKLTGQDVGLFFYAGHGVQVKGHNYLIPIDAKLANENDAEYDCVRADRVLAKMEVAGSRTNIVILDACRDNPFQRSWRRAIEGSGLAFMNAPSGSLIAYSTAPGKTALDGEGRYSPYTEALLQHIETPNITIIQMFQRVRSQVAKVSQNKQTPWESTSLKGDFYFAGIFKGSHGFMSDTIPTPSESGASFEDILKAGKEQRQIMERWTAWQSDREREYVQAQKIDRDPYLKPEQKRIAWKRFLSAISDDNPFSEKDEELRAKAKERVTYWKEYKVASIPLTPENASPLASGSNKIDQDGVYINYANGIVKDTSTGLEWKAGPDKDFDWYQARSWVQSLGDEWRMPTLNELKTLYKKGKGDRNMTPLLKTTAWWVWSAEVNDSGDASVWLFDTGVRIWRDLFDNDHKRSFAVRSQSESKNQKNVVDRDGNYVAYSNGIVRDTKTGLEWKVGPDTDMSWDEARGWLEVLNLHEKKWRMPTIDELSSLYKNGAGRRNISPLFKTSGWWVWSAKPRNSPYFFSFSFGYGEKIHSDRFARVNGRAFAVRSESDN